MRFADLHLHTIFSDSTYTPEGLLREAKIAGLSCISVVDHDTVAGIAPTLDLAEIDGIEVIPGIELSAEYEGLEVHILGYLIDYANKELIAKTDYLRKNRIERIHKIVEKLKKLMGVELRADTVLDMASHGTVGRLHVARAMLKEGLVRSTSEAFQKYIGDKCPAYVLGFKFSPKEAIELIKRIGGVPVLAHPYSLHRDELIPELIDFGIMGLEVYYPEHSQSTVNFYAELAKKYNLLVTGGSDCHGAAKPEVKIGSVKIPYDLVERLKEIKGEIK